MLDFNRISVKNLDHLGIVAGLVDEIGIVDIVNNALGIDSLEQISKGQVVKAMILNGLGFVSRPLYLFSQFFEDKPCQKLLGNNVKTEYLNDDKLGRVLDQLYEYGLTNLFMEIVISTVKQFKIQINDSHVDSSSFHLHGQYNKQELITNENPEENSKFPQQKIVITKGYSRDNRPDLKQVVLNLIVSNDGEIPTYFKGGNGNKSDKKELVKVAIEYQKQISSAMNEEIFMIGDGALFSSENLQILGETRWITRVPCTIKSAKEIIELSEFTESITKEKESKLEKSLREKGYKWQSTQSNYGGMNQRWLLVESQQRKKSDWEKIEKKIPQEKEELTRKIKEINKKEWCEEKEYKKEIKKINKKLKYHQLEIERTEKIEKKKIKYKVKVKTMTKEVEIERKKRGAGRFILATNIEKEKLKEAEILEKYKNQQSVERGFRFLKTPSFFAESFYVNKVERIEGKLWLMTVCLLVYNLGQREIRKKLKRVNGGIKNQLGKKTDRPTLKWIFQNFQGIHEIKIKGESKVLNMTKTREEILKYLPLECQKYY